MPRDRVGSLDFGHFAIQACRAAGDTFKLVMLPVELTLPRPVGVLSRRDSYLSPAAVPADRGAQAAGTAAACTAEVNSSQKSGRGQE